MPSTRHIVAAVLIALAFHASRDARAAESYDSCAGFIDSVPASITTQGVWCLRHDLATSMVSGTAIQIGVNNVTIDCNGFKIGGLAAGDASTATGISASDRQNITVRNCTIRGFFRGISLSGGNAAGHLVENNRLDNNLYIGIVVGGENNMVRRNLVFDTGNGPANVYALVGAADFIENIVSGVSSLGSNWSYGIQVSGNAQEIRGNRIAGLSNAGGLSYGIQTTGSRHAITGNHIANVPSVTGFGISADTGTFCRDNNIAGYSTAINACRMTGGNDSF